MAAVDTDVSLPAVYRRRHGQGSKMSYVERSLVPGETLLYQTRHHWMVLIGPLMMTLMFLALATGLFVEAIEAKNGKGLVAGASAQAVHGMDFVAIALVAAAIGTIGYGV